ncbi:hypothetical protein P167DRAFT_41033 [Morchella conica CCBAS932]|uniref:Uncharacterized protein n=1 Tax=Morchella conica CCBAS932 TaxID=1392247 RepID=A0A3N4KW13_9PEZI|nr:hypothetical protein P167DRAFT_41033 [Morchella conica CCBAS932]
MAQSDQEGPCVCQALFYPWTYMYVCNEYRLIYLRIYVSTHMCYMCVGSLAVSTADTAGNHGLLPYRRLKKLLIFVVWVWHACEAQRYVDQDGTWTTGY